MNIGIFEVVMLVIALVVIAAIIALVVLGVRALLKVSQAADISIENGKQQKLQQGNQS